METLNNSRPPSSATIFDSVSFSTRLTSKWLALVSEFSRIKNSDEIYQTVVNQYLHRQGQQFVVEVRPLRLDEASPLQLKAEAAADFEESMSQDSESRSV